MWGVIRITEAGTKSNYLTVTSIKEQFPPDAIGGENKKDAPVRTIKVHWGGDPVETYIVHGTGGWYFYSRGWEAKFFEKHNLRAGDKVVVERMEPYTFHVYPLRQIE